MNVFGRNILIFAAAIVCFITPLQGRTQTTDETPQVASAPSGRYDAKAVVRNAKSVYVYSKAVNLPLDLLTSEFSRNRNWSKLGLTIVPDRSVADLSIQIDRPQFAYIYTYLIVDNDTAKVLGSGKVTSLNAAAAGGAVVSEVVKVLTAGR